MTYIIAEVGSNWSTFADCSNSISMAKACGADAVKFQLYTHKALYGYDVAGLLSMKGELPRSWIPLLSEKAKAVGIDFIVSVFDLDDVEFLAPHVDAFKIASCEFMYFDLYAAIKETGKKLIASCGAHTYQEVDILMGVEDGKYRPDVLMYCTVDYPSTQHDLRHVKRLVANFPGVDIGYSDHSLDVFAAPLIAVEYGATYIEKHFKLDHIADTPDADHSLNTSDFKLMVKAIRGSELYDLHAFQNEAVLRHKRRVKAVQSIAKGENLRFGENIGFVRSKVDDMVGASYLALTCIVGKPATKDYVPGDPINPGDYA